MASITVRNLEDPLKARLRLRAAHHGRSMEEEVRSILREVLTDQVPTRPHLGEAIRQRFSSLGGVDIEPPVREPVREAPGFEE